jgi:hypothetical protein
MPRRLGPITRKNKDVAEFVFGNAPGRPTFSRRTGRVLSEVNGIDDTCVDLFHLCLILGGAAGGAAWLDAPFGVRFT